jgi:hypothetical protein
VAEARTPRRVVTKLGDDGKSYIARDEELAEMDYGTVDPARMKNTYPGWGEGEHPEIRVVWGTTQLPFRQPEQQDAPPSESGEMPSGRPFVRMSHITYPPGWQGEMFWTNTTDVIWIISGEFTYVTDSGDEVTLRPGDTLIQNGTNKSLQNRGSEPAVIGVVMCATERVGPSPQEAQAAASGAMGARGPGSVRD